MSQQIYEKEFENLCVSVQCARVCQVGSEETNGLISQQGFEVFSKVIVSADTGCS